MDLNQVIANIASFTIPLITGYALDLWLGDPRRVPHPVRLFGWIISLSEEWLNKGRSRFIKGAITSILLVGATWGGLALLFKFVAGMPFLYYPLASIMIYFSLANRELVNEARQVERELVNQGLEAGRIRVARIVGRDTAGLSTRKIRMANLETLSENLSDGVIAPLLYYLVGGVPLMLTYKMINTLDSMIGYKSDRYFWYGKLAARLDDLANLVPARLTSLLMIIANWQPGLLKFVMNNGGKHQSPNSGWPEAALAGILDCQLGGPSTYNGQLNEKPFIGTNTRELTSADIEKACSVNLKVALGMVVLVISLHAITALLEG